MDRERRDTRADRDRSHCLHRRDRATEPLGATLGIRDVASGHDHRELLTAVSGRRVEGAGLVLEELRHLAEDLIPHLMSVRVVELFEVVDVHQHH